MRSNAESLSRWAPCPMTTAGTSPSSLSMRPVLNFCCSRSATIPSLSRSSRWIRTTTAQAAREQRAGTLREAPPDSVPDTVQSRLDAERVRRCLGSLTDLQRESVIELQEVFLVNLLARFAVIRESGQVRPATPGQAGQVGTVTAAASSLRSASPAGQAGRGRDRG